MKIACRALFSFDSIVALKNEMNESRVWSSCKMYFMEGLFMAKWVQTRHLDHDHVRIL